MSLLQNIKKSQLTSVTPFSFSYLIFLLCPHIFRKNFSHTYPRNTRTHRVKLHINHICVRLHQLNTGRRNYSRFLPTSFFRTIRRSWWTCGIPKSNATRNAFIQENQEDNYFLWIIVVGSLSRLMENKFN